MDAPFYWPVAAVVFVVAAVGLFRHGGLDRTNRFDVAAVGMLSVGASVLWPMLLVGAGPMLLIYLVANVIAAITPPKQKRPNGR